MANKYELFLIPTVRDQKPKHQPWYKERMQAKLLSSPMAVGSRTWRFVNESADDFRNGQPVDQPLIVKGRQEVLPVIGSSKAVPAWKLAIQKRPTVPKSSSPQSSTRNLTIPVEMSANPEGRRKHRLQQLQELEDSIRDEHNSIQFEQFLNGLEEKKSVDKTSDVTGRVGGEALNPSESQADEESSDNDEEMSASAHCIEPDYSHLPHLGLWQDVSMQSERKHSTHWKESAGEKSGCPMRKAALDDERLASVVNQLCTWENGVGNVVKPTLDEVTVYHMFGMGNESKPAPDMSVKIVDSSSLPADFRRGRITEQNSTSSILPRMSTSVTAHTPLDTSAMPHQQKSSKVKLDYGAWYLPKSHWSARPHGEPLEDPLEQKRREEEQRAKELRKVPGSDDMMAQIRQFSQDYRAKHSFHHQS